MHCIFEWCVVDVKTQEWLFGMLAYHELWHEALRRKGGMSLLEFECGFIGTRTMG